MYLGLNTTKNQRKHFYTLGHDGLSLEKIRNIALVLDNALGDRSKEPGLGVWLAGASSNLRAVAIAANSWEGLLEARVLQNEEGK